MQDHDVAEAIRSLVSQLARRLNSSSSALGLSPAHASALALVSSRGRISMAELTQVERLNPTMASRVVSTLRSRGLVLTSRDRQDRRIVLVEPTEAGVEARERLRSARSAVLGRALATLELSDRIAIEGALPALQRLVRQLD